MARSSRRWRLSWASRTTTSMCGDFDGGDVWVGTSKGLGWAIGPDYYAGLRERPVQFAQATSEAAPAQASSKKH